LLNNIVDDIDGKKNQEMSEMITLSCSIETGLSGYIYLFIYYNIQSDYDDNYIYITI